MSWNKQKVNPRFFWNHIHIYLKHATEKKCSKYFSNNTDYVIMYLQLCNYSNTFLLLPRSKHVFEEMVLWSDENISDEIE